MQLTGSQIVIECLKEQGVDTVFGYPGGAILNDNKYPKTEFSEFKFSLETKKEKH